METADLVSILRLGRLHFVVGGFLLYTFGSMLALSGGAELDLSRFLLGYAVLFCAHLSVSYSNDYYDVEADAHTTATPISGGSKVLVERPHLRRPALAIAIGLILASLFLMAVFAWSYPVHPAFFGLVIGGNLLGFYYTAPPARLAYRGLGEVATMVTIGVLVPAMGYIVVSGNLDGAFLVFVPALLLYGMLFIVIVQLPDLEGDRLGGKDTLVVRRGRRFGYLLAAASAILATAYFVFIALVAPGAVPVDPRAAIAFSLVPAAFAIGAALRGDLGFPGAARAATATMGSLFAFNILFNTYMLLALG